MVVVLSTADLVAIAARCQFPDWLGYIGLALNYTEDAEQENHEITRAWVPQLATLVRPESSASALLGTLLPESSRALTWRDLEAVESGAAR